MEIITLACGAAVGVGLTYIAMNKKHNQLQTSLGITQSKLEEMDKILSKNDEQQNNLKSWGEKVSALSAINGLLEENLRNSKQETSAKLKQIEELQEQKGNLNKEKTRLESTNKALQEKLDTQKEEIINIQKTAHTEFKNIANEILKTNSSEFTTTNKTNIEALLKPLKENIQSFETKVTEETKYRFSLGEEVKNLVNKSDQIGRSADNLVNALKGNAKTQGGWGEVILEKILQLADLSAGKDYYREESFKNENNENLRPDFVVKLPGDNGKERKLVIDSKTSVVAYERFCSTDDVDEQKRHLKDHISSIKAHITTLSSREYQKLSGSPDFILMFIPIEPAYIEAIKEDSDLWEYAYKKKILLVSQTNLIACMKLVQELWRMDRQSKNQEKILDEASGLYKHFCLVLESMSAVGKGIEAAQIAFDQMVKRSESGKGHLVSRFENLQTLGIKVSKSIKDGKISPKLLPEEFLEEDKTEESESKEISKAAKELETVDVAEDDEAIPF